MGFGFLSSFQTCFKPLIKFKHLIFGKHLKIEIFGKETINLNSFEF